MSSHPLFAPPALDRLADRGTSLPPHDAATFDLRKPRLFTWLNQWATAREGFVHGQLGFRRSFALPSRLGLFALLALGGCSAPRATVTGTVTADGKPVSGGSITLAPRGGPGDTAPGKPGASEIRPDGSYSVTLEPGTRGLAARFTVRFAPPVLPPLSEAEAKVRLPPYQGFVPRHPDIEVRPGANIIDIELVAAGKK